MTANQTQNGGTWNFLTTINLNTANNLTVTLSGQGNGTVIADAIRIVPNATTQTQNNTYFIYTDHLDTPREIRNYANQLRWTWYAEQAEALGANVPNDNPAALGAFTYNLRFPGQIYDAATGLSYNDNRVYAGRTGRYITSDPIGLDAGQMSTYTYVDGKPLLWVDPRGLERWDFDGQGDTSVCTYYDKKAEENPSCGYYKEAAKICRGQKSIVNGLTRSGIAVSYLKPSFTDSQSVVLNKLRKRLVERDARERASGNIDSCGCPNGDAIDKYHNEVFREVGLPPFFYGGNIGPQNSLGNPVPYDSRGFDPIDDLFN